MENNMKTDIEYVEEADAFEVKEREVESNMILDYECVKAIGTKAKRAIKKDGNIVEENIPEKIKTINKGT